jgi:hypothetical protein
MSNINAATNERILFLLSFTPTIPSAATAAVAAAVAEVFQEFDYRIDGGCNDYQKCYYLLPHNFTFF